MEKTPYQPHLKPTMVPVLQTPAVTTDWRTGLSRLPGSLVILREEWLEAKTVWGTKVIH